MRLVLCDDHRLFVEPLAAALARQGHDVVVANTATRTLEAVAEHHPDVVVLDLTLPDGHGLDILAALRARSVTCPVVILSASVDVRDLAAAAAAGAAAFLRKDQPITAIFDALDRVAAGRAVPAPPVTRRRVETGERERVRRLVDALTDRERQVLRLLIRAEDTSEICRILRVGASTARTHVQNVLFKLGVHTRLQAVALVVAAGLDQELMAGQRGFVAPAPPSVPHSRAPVAGARDPGAGARDPRTTARDVVRPAHSAGRPAHPAPPGSSHARDPRSPRG